MSFTMFGFNTYAQTLDHFVRAFPVKAKGWGVTHFDCSLVYDDEDRTSCIRIRRHAEMRAYGSDEVTREGVEVNLYLNKKDASRDELETARLRACREFVPGHWQKGSYIGWDGDHSFPGDRFEILWG